ncbi:MAG: hypothetical protein F6K41_06105 [Symploca sp. SIO3E6]|nr:hypothetical protein [Caldora sp. SIO3E6]
MTEHQAQQNFEGLNSNVLPLPSATSTAQEEFPQLFSNKDLQKRYTVSSRQVRNYAAIVRDAYPWLEGELKNGNKYTVLMVQLIDEFKESGMSSAQWIEHIHDENAEKLQIAQVDELTEDVGITGGLALITQEDSPFAGLAVTTKASDRVQVLQGELELIESSADEDFGDFLSITAELEAEDEASTQQDELEWQALRKKNAQKWLKRRAILERDKQQILQGDVPLPKKS